jgi:hypothetical protein
MWGQSGVGGCSVGGIRRAVLEMKRTGGVLALVLLRRAIGLKGVRVK